MLLKGNLRYSVTMLLVAWSFAGLAQAESTYLIADSLIDPLQGRKIRNPVVEIEGDRIVSVTPGGTVPALSSTGGHCDNNLLPADYDVTASGVADGPWAVRRQVRKNRKYGVDVIKICATGGTSSKGTDPGVRQYTFEEIEAIVDEAHTLGLQVAAHAHGAEGIRFAIRAGVDSVEHASLIDAEGLDLAKRNGTFLSLNAYTPVYMVAHGEAAGMLPETVEKARALKKIRLENYRLAIEQGASVVFGSDAATYPHGDNAKQFALYVMLGMSPMEAIQSATTVAARSLGWSGDTGAIAPGYFADIIAVAGDPLDDVSHLENVVFVMKGGKVYKQTD